MSKYVYIVQTQHFGPVGSSSQAILGVHTSKRNGLDHYNECLEYRRKGSMFKSLTMLPVEGKYPPGLEMPERRVCHARIEYTNDTSERLKLLRWNVCRASQLKGKHDRSRRKQRDMG